LQSPRFVEDRLKNPLDGLPIEGTAIGRYEPFQDFGFSFGRVRKLTSLMFFAPDLERILCSLIQQAQDL